MYERNHLCHSLARFAKLTPDAVFLTHWQTGRVVRYREFFDNAERMAAALQRAGVAPGDRVAVQAPKTVAMLELYVATVLAGAVFLPLNTSYQAAEVAYFLGDATPALLVCEPKKHRALLPVARACGVGTIWTLAADESGSLTDHRDAENAAFEVVERSDSDLAAILYTSGTTGRSKGAMLSHGALRSNSETLRDCWRFTSHDVLVHALPIYHTHGLFVATNVTMMAGGSLRFMPAFDAEQVCSAMRGASALMGVPTFYVRLLQQPGLAQNARGMRLFISGSAPLLDATHKRWEALTGHVILERYGMTETSMNTSNPYDGERRAGTVGFPLPLVELRVVDGATGEVVEPGERGMIEVRGPNLFSGYWQMPEKTSQEMRKDGFLITGDIGRVDDAGYLSIVGRARDMIITGGLNVYPKEIERVIDGLDGVLESAVIGVPHPDLGEAVVAVVVAEQGAELVADAIADGISDALAGFKRPKEFVFVQELARNTMGKVQKNILREQFAGLFA